MLIAAGVAGVLAWWVPATQAHTALPWQVYPFGVVAIGGLYWALAALLPLWPWTRWDSKVLLRACYKDGRTLQRRLAQRKSLDPEAAETEARYSACRWAEETWKVLKQHFEGYAQEFFGPGKMVLAETPSAFDFYCQNDIERRFGSASAFLEQKLQYIEGLLK
jgi:hypothetical protein